MTASAYKQYNNSRKTEMETNAKKNPFPKTKVSFKLFVSNKVAHTCHLRTQEAKAGRLELQTSLD